MVPETKAQGCAENLISGGGPCWLDDDAAGQFRLRSHLDSRLHHHRIAALFAAVTAVNAERRDAAQTIYCAVITGLSLILMECT